MGQRRDAEPVHGLNQAKRSAPCAACITQDQSAHALHVGLIQGPWKAPWAGSEGSRCHPFVTPGLRGCEIKSYICWICSKVQLYKCILPGSITLPQFYSYVINYLQLLYFSSLLFGFQLRIHLRLYKNSINQRE